MINLQDLPVANFPDGHRHIVLPDDFALPPGNGVSVAIRSFDDLFLLAQFKEIFPQITELHIVYLLGARCDRSFSSGEAFDLRIIANFINDLCFERVTVLKPHSDVAGELIDNMEEADLTPVLMRSCEQQNNLGHYGLVCPDKGASLWIGDYVKSGDSRALTTNVLIQCEKQRDMATELATISADSKETPRRAISGIVVPDLPVGVTDYMIVDDLCDGGGTFLGIASDLREKGAERVFLVVSHAIFSKGVEVFDGLIDKVYCTNSFADFDSPLVHQHNVQ